MRASKWTLALALLLGAGCRSETSLDERTSRIASAVTVTTMVDDATALKVTAAAADVPCNGDGQLTITMEQAPPLRYSLILDDGKEVTAAGFDAAKSIATSIVQAKTNARFDILRSGDKNSLDFSFSTTQSPAIVSSAIGSLGFRGTVGRDLGAAIGFAMQDYDNTTSASSPWNLLPGVAVIITDGHVEAGACTAASALTSRNIVPVVVTVGPNIDASGVSCFTGGGARLISSFSVASLDAAVKTAIPAQEFVVQGTPGAAFTFIEPFTTSTGSAGLVGGKLQWKDNPSSSVVVPFHHSSGSAVSPSTLLGGMSISRKSSPSTTAALPDVAINVTGSCIPTPSLSPPTATTSFGAPATITLSSVPAAGDCVRLYRDCTTASVTSCSGPMPGVADVKTSSYSNSSLAPASYSNIRGFYLVGCTGTPPGAGSGAVERIVTAGTAAFATISTGNRYPFGSGTTTLSATLGPSFAGGDPAGFASSSGFGSVQFYRDPPGACASGTAVGAPVAVSGVGAASLTPGSSDIPIGTHQICAVYTPNPAAGFYYAGAVASGNAALVVDPIAATVAISGTPNPSTVGTSVNLTVTVTSPNTVAPTGTLAVGLSAPAFNDIAASIPCPSASCTVASNIATATVSVPGTRFLSTGTRNIQATFTGSGPFGSALASYDQVVNATATTLSALSLTTPITFGAPNPFSVTLGPSTAGPFTAEVSFRDGSNAGFVLCAASVSAANVATCTPPPGALAGGGHTIYAVYPGDATHFAVEGSAALVVNEATPAMTAVTRTTPPDAASVVYGTSASFATTVTGVAGATKPSGTVTFTDNAADIAGCVALPLATDGSATCTPLATLDAKTHAIAARYIGGGDPNYGNATAAAFSHVVTEAPTTTTIVTSTVTPSAPGQAIDFTVQVSNATSGKVIVRDGAATVVDPCTPRAPGTWICTTTFTTLGAHTITAVFDPSNVDPNHAGSTSAPFTQNVANPGGGGGGPAPSVAAVSFVAPGSPLATLGDAVTFTARVTGNAARPGGTVTWAILAQPAGSPAVALANAPLPASGNDEVSLTIPATQLRAGTYVVTATYSGDATYPAPPAVAFTETIGKGTVGSFTVTPSPAPSHYGEPVTFTATATGNASGVSPGGGVVTFVDDVNGVLGTAVMNAQGVATLASGRLAVSTAHSVQATYDATKDASYLNATALTGAFAVAPAPVKVTLLPASVNPSRPGNSVTFTVSLELVKGHGQPNGAVSIIDTVNGVPTTLCGGAQACTRVVTGPDDDAHDGASFAVTTTALAAGKHAISATYDPVADPRFTLDGEIQGSPREQIVDANAQTVTLTSSDNPSIARQTVTFTAKIANTDGPPAGVVTFADGTTPLGTGTIASGQATLPTSALAAGTHTITASYGTVTASLSQVVNRAATTTTLAASANPATAGQASTLTATITSTTPGPIGGTLSFKDGDTKLGTATAANGAGTITVTLGEGAHAIRVDYEGDDVYAPSTGALNVTAIPAKAGGPDAGASDGGLSLIPAAATDDGCGCRTAPSSNRGSLGFALGLLLLFARRRASKSRCNAS